MLSLSPRYDLIRFKLPKTFIPTEIEAKYTEKLNSDAYTLNNAIDYLNESIQGVTIPGMSGLTIVQQQHGRNSINAYNTNSYVDTAKPINLSSIDIQNNIGVGTDNSDVVNEDVYNDSHKSILGRINKHINVEPMHEITHLSPGNPLEKIEKEFKVTFRSNQGLLNYFMLYETAFYYACREYRWSPEQIMVLDILNEDGTVTSRITFYDVYIEGIDGLEFTYNKIEREANVFDVTFKFNNINFEYFGNNGLQIDPLTIE